MEKQTLVGRYLPRRIKMGIQNLANRYYFPRWLGRSEMNRTIDENILKFTSLKKDIGFIDYNFKDKNIIEIGPGDLFGFAYFFLAEGAKNVRVVDNYNWMRRMIRYSSIMKYYKENIEKEYRKRLDITLHPTESTPKLQLFINEYGNSGYKENEIDFIYSCACLEHIRQIGPVFKNMFKVLKKGGIMFHYVDLRDHYDLNVPLDYLRLSDNVWESQNHPDDSYTNRHRVNDYRIILSQYPHKRLRFVPKFDEFKAPQDINDKFKNYNDIDAVGLLMIVEKL